MTQNYCQYTNSHSLEVKAGFPLDEFFGFFAANLFLFLCFGLMLFRFRNNLYLQQK